MSVAPNATFHVRDVLRVIDGDTVQVIVDKYHGDLRILTVRLLEIDTPEKKDRERWQAAKEFTELWLAHLEGSGGLYFEGHRMDSFGRGLGYFWYGATGENLSYMLAANGYGERVPLHQHLKQLGGVV